MPFNRTQLTDAYPSGTPILRALIGPLPPTFPCSYINDRYLLKSDQYKNIKCNSNSLQLKIFSVIALHDEEARSMADARVAHLQGSYWTSSMTATGLLLVAVPSEAV